MLKPTNTPKTGRILRNFTKLHQSRSPSYAVPEFVAGFAPKVRLAHQATPKAAALAATPSKVEKGHTGHGQGTPVPWLKLCQIDSGAKQAPVIMAATPLGLGATGKNSTPHKGTNSVQAATSAASHSTGKISLNCRAMHKAGSAIPTVAHRLTRTRWAMVAWGRQ